MGNFIHTVLLILALGSMEIFGNSSSPFFIELFGREAVAIASGAAVIILIFMLKGRLS